MLDIVLVNWNSGRQLLDAVLSIVNYHAGLVTNVVVVDNNSTDGSLEALKEQLHALPFCLQFVENRVNEGFGAACNRGARLCNGDYLLFLNPDAKLFVGSLAAPLAYIQSAENSNVGICGVQLLNERQVVARSCARFPSAAAFVAEAVGLSKFPGLHSLGHHMTEWRHTSTRQVDHVIGAFYLIRRHLFDSLSGFDERFFVYLEDLDLSLRARRAGWRCVYYVGAQAFHAGGGTSRQVKATRLFYSLRSRLLYGFKHFSPPQAWTVVGVTLLLEPVPRLFWSLLRGSAGDARDTLRGYVMLWRALPRLLGSERR
ncbi:N-acetylglucosaminyl-diphospho-decaprenol L-rhamnosyltransferase [Variovorax sp. PBL-H6]|uniref:glycosyltransferase n=1 Tax=Variovorax sp. PBL-H6 TaxID=434009 RepID=UPI001316A171|nr:glycosyltransferase family 2 protein [Variovorax sp. PBL-H6]VTU38657.1 N-acetylglucosaminyl-diphospho-decaprenol L-rhamnosyltransferase [Variovorax sp. PBL-H6]